MDKNEELLSELKYLKLKSFVDYMDEVESSNLSLRDSLLELCRHEVRRRHDNSVLRRIKLAGFPKTKTLAMLNFDLAAGSLLIIDSKNSFIIL